MGYQIVSEPRLPTGAIATYKFSTKSNSFVAQRYLQRIFFLCVLLPFVVRLEQQHY